MENKSCVSVSCNNSVRTTAQRTDATARLYWMLKLEQLAAKFDFGFSFSPPIKGVRSEDMIVNESREVCGEKCDTEEKKK